MVLARDCGSQRSGPVTRNARPSSNSRTRRSTNERPTQHPERLTSSGGASRLRPLRWPYRRPVFRDNGFCRRHRSGTEPAVAGGRAMLMRVRIPHLTSDQAAQIREHLTRAPAFGRRPVPYSHPMTVCESIPVHRHRLISPCMHGTRRGSDVVTPPVCPLRPFEGDGARRPDGTAKRRGEPSIRDDGGAPGNGAPAGAFFACAAVPTSPVPPNTQFPNQSSPRTRGRTPRESREEEP